LLPIGQAADGSPNELTVLGLGIGFGQVRVGEVPKVVGISSVALRPIPALAAVPEGAPLDLCIDGSL